MGHETAKSTAAPGPARPIAGFLACALRRMRERRTRAARIDIVSIELAFDELAPIERHEILGFLETDPRRGADRLCAIAGFVHPEARLRSVWTSPIGARARRTERVRELGALDALCHSLMQLRTARNPRLVTLTWASEVGVVTLRI